MKRPDWASRDPRTAVMVLSAALAGVAALGTAVLVIVLTAGGFL